MKTLLIRVHFICTTTIPGSSSSNVFATAPHYGYDLELTMCLEYQNTTTLASVAPFRWKSVCSKLERKLLER